MTFQPNNTTPPPAIEAPKRKRPLARVRDGGKVGKLVPMRNLSGEDRAKLAAMREALDAEVQAWRDDIERDLGGDLSAQRRTLLDLAALKMRTALVLGRWIAARPTGGRGG